MCLTCPSFCLEAAQICSKRPSGAGPAVSDGAARSRARPLQLQRQLITLVIDLGDRRSRRAACPGCRCRRSIWRAKLARGVPALAGEPMPLPCAALTPRCCGFCDALAAGGAGEAADAHPLRRSRRRHRAGSLFAASLARDQRRFAPAPSHRASRPIWCGWWPSSPSARSCTRCSSAASRSDGRCRRARRLEQATVPPAARGRRSPKSSAATGCCAARSAPRRGS